MESTNVHRALVEKARQSIAKTRVEKFKAVIELIMVSREVAKEDPRVLEKARDLHKIIEAKVKVFRIADEASAAEDRFWLGVSMWDYLDQKSTWERQQRGSQEPQQRNPPRRSRKKKKMIHSQEVPRIALETHASVREATGLHARDAIHQSSYGLRTLAASPCPPILLTGPAFNIEDADHLHQRDEMSTLQLSTLQHAHMNLNHRNECTFMVRSATPCVRVPSTDSRSNPEVTDSYPNQEKFDENFEEGCPLDPWPKRYLKAATEDLANAALDRLEAAEELMKLTEDLEKAVGAKGMQTKLARAKERLIKASAQVAKEEKALWCRAKSEDLVSSRYSVC